MFTPLRATATISQHVPPLCAILADVVSTPSERRQHPDAERARRVQSIVSSPLIVGQDQTQAHSSCTVRGASRQLLGPDDGSHIHRIVRPRCRTESPWLRAGQVWACTRPLQSCTQQLNWCAVDELSFSCLSSSVLLLWGVLPYHRINEMC